MADEDGRYSEMITQVLRHVTSKPRDADVKGDIFGHTICPPSLVAVAFIFSELRGGGGGIPPPPPPTPVVEDQKKPGLNRVKGNLCKLRNLSCHSVQISTEFGIIHFRNGLLKRRMKSIFHE